MAIFLIIFSVPSSLKVKKRNAKIVTGVGLIVKLLSADMGLLRRDLVQDGQFEMHPVQVHGFVLPIG
jgi:hypothetical protein